MAPLIRLVVFDWDGTLIDSIGAIVSCTEAALEELELDPVPPERIRTLIGLGVAESVVHLCPGADDRVVVDLVHTYRRLWYSTYQSRPELFPGAEAAVRGLSERGAFVAIATAKPRRGLRADLQMTGMEGIFHATRTGDEAPGKPNPTMLVELLDELGVRATEALMVGDTTHDLQMAQNAGVPGVGVTSGGHPAVELSKHEPLTCLAMVAELPAWLEDRGFEHG